MEYMGSRKKRNWILLLLALCLGLGGCGVQAADGPGNMVATPFWGAVPEQATIEMETFLDGRLPLASPEDLALELPNTEDQPVIEPILSEEALRSAMETYGIEAGSTAESALETINNTYAAELFGSWRAGCMIFVFEGAGSEPDPEQRKNAMCVVVRDGQITYLNQNSSTIPDYPFSPWKNEGRDTPTLKSGIYAFDTVNHNGLYAALRVKNDRVVRFHTQSEFYEDVSYRQSIQLHRRVTEGLAPADEAWGNSVGCLLIGSASTAWESDYAAFLRAVGVVSSRDGGNIRYRYQVGGTVIVDRTFGADYLRSVGYSDEAIALIESGRAG